MWQIQIRYGQKKLRYQSRREQWITLLALLGMVLVACSGPQTQSGGPSPVTANDPPDRTASPTVGMQRGDMLYRGGEVTVGQTPPVVRAQVRVMFMFQGPGQEPNQAVETALTSKFQGYGYRVLDAGTVAQTL